MIKAAFFDIDCTLYSWANRRYVESGVKAIKAAQKKGLKVFLCTSRPYHSMYHFGVMDLGIHWDGWVACAGGVSCIKNKIIYEEPLDEKTVRSFVKLAQKEGLMMQLVTPKSRYYTAEKNEYYQKFAETFEEPDAPVHPYHGKRVSTMLLFAPESYDEEFKQAFPQLSFFRFHEYGIEVTDQPKSKGRGAKAILDALGISKDEAIGFGDDYADITMKDGVGTFVAMGNAREEVKKEANFITADIDDDGIAKGLAHFGY